jgi:O-antigen/teichoic acid export membrane protein
MMFGFQDIRGYDSIIPRQYVEYMGWIEPQDELLYNRIAPLSELQSLESPLLHLLGVKYVIATQAIDRPGYKLVYDGEVKVYENANAMPRAFALPESAAVIVPGAQVGDALQLYDPREHVVLEEEQGYAPIGAAQASLYSPVAVERYSGSEVFLKAALTQRSWVVLADSYFPGWKAYGRAEGEEDERELTIYRADGNFRAVLLEAGTHTIRFKYTPMAFKLGLYASFITVMTLLLLGVFALWRRFYRADAGGSAVKRVARNSLVLMGMSLVNRFIDLVFAMLMLRILTPVGAGRFQTAVNLIGYFEILVLFGLGTLLTREAAKKPEEQRRYLGNTLTLRLLLWAVSMPILAGILFVSARYGNMAAETVWAVLLFSVGMIFSSFAEAISSVFYANEQMEYPAAISSVTTILRVMLGALALLVGWGVVGLAGVSAVANIITLAIMAALAARFYFHPRMELEPAFGRKLLFTSYPLMINHLLATIFFRIDIQFLQHYRGDAEVGYYSAAHRWIDALQIIPSYFTLAIFPLMSRYAESARDSLVRAYILSLRVLLIFILPVTVITLFISRELIALLGGASYLPQSMIALQLLILSRPFGFINGVTQYVLISIDQQRFLTKAFLIGMTFNVVANFLFVPKYGYQAAAAIMIFSEIALLLPFYYAIRKHLTRVPWVGITWQPLVASLVCGGILWVVRPLSLLLALGLAIVAYPVALWLLGGFRGQDLDVMWNAIPLGRVRGFLRRKSFTAESAETTEEKK